MLSIGSLSKREKIILIIAIGVIVFSSFSKLILIPYLRMSGALDKEIFQLHNKLTKARRLIPRKYIIEKEFQGIAASHMPQDEGVAGEQQIARILIALEDLSNQAGVRLTDIRPRPAQSLDYYNEYIIEARFEAGINEISRFIYEIQASKELLKIEKLQLNIKSSESSLLEGYLEIHKISL